MTPLAPTAIGPLIARPIAHRGLHDAAAGVPENALSAIRAAAAAGYGIEIDLQPRLDGEPIVFHDAMLERMTGLSGPIAAASAETLAAARLGGTDEPIPSLADALSAAGGAPMVVEIKPAPPGLAAETPAQARYDDRIADLASRYAGPIALMSFEDARLAAMQARAPTIPRGVLSERADGVAARVERYGAAFASLHQGALAAAQTLDLRRRGLTVVTWTVRSSAEAARASALCDQITFEGFLPPLGRPFGADQG